MMKNFIRITSRPFLRNSYSNVLKSCLSTSTPISVLDHVPIFKKLLEEKEGAVLVANSPTEDNFVRYNQDWTKKYYGKSQLVLKPSNVTEVSRILEYCNDNKIGVVPQGGNTSLVGGAIALYPNDVILSLERMNKILHHDSINGVLTVEAGCVLEVIENWLKDNTECTIPYDLGAKGSCQIGGNVATNAGGLRLVRYGNLHGAVLGLEVVLPNGEILTQNMISVHSSNIQTSLRKDNTGYDLKQLFIGSEGTLGIITKVSIHTPQKSSSINVCLLKLHPLCSIQEIATIFQLSKTHLNEILSAFEFWDIQSQLLKESIPSISPSIPDGNNFILIETMGSHMEHDNEKLFQFLEILQSKQITMKDEQTGRMKQVDLLVDGIIAKDVKEQKQLWQQRESIPLAAASHLETLTVLKYDLSIPQLHMYDPIVLTRKRLEEWWNQSEDAKEFHSLYQIPLAIGFGHFGDGNIHLNVLIRKSIKDSTPSNKKLPLSAKDKDFIQTVINVLEPWIFHQITKEYMGSISAEHGIGIQKTHFFPMFKSPTEYKIMKALKELFDPNHIMNPGKLFTAVPNSTSSNPN